MTLIDDPRAWILRLFEMEEREGRGSHCDRFLEGTRPAGISLEDGESVFGIYKKKYYFTPRSLIIADSGNTKRIRWAEVVACSSKHGEGKRFSDLTLADGRMIRVRIADMGTGWSGRISQLYHQMIERFGKLAAMGRPLMPMSEFFATADDDYCFAPNLEPHPTLESFRFALCELERANVGTKVLIALAEGDEEPPVADGVVIVTSKPSECFQGFSRDFGADGVIAADENTLRKVGRLSAGLRVWHVLWD
jgi:hypothetical protein